MVMHWMAWSALVAALLGVGAAAVERGLSALGRPVRWAWLGALVLSLAAPAALWVAPRPAPAPAPVPLAPAARVGGPVLLPEAPSPMRTEAPRAWLPAAEALDGPLLLAWAGASAGMLALLLGLGTALRWRRRGWSAEVVDGQAVLVSVETGPAVVGLLRGEIVLPRWALEAPAEARALMIAHEREHLRAGDPRLLLAGIAVAVAMPWSPAVWWQLRRLRLAVEMDCDRRVLGTRGDVKRYGSLLLEMGRGSASPGLLSPLALPERAPLLERRIRAMTMPRPRAPRARAAACAAFAALAVAAACEAPRPLLPGAGASEPVAGRGVTAERVPAAAALSPAEVRRLVGEHFPGVLERGLGGRDHLTLVLDAEGRVVRAAASGARVRGDTMRIAGMEDLFTPDLRPAGYRRLEGGPDPVPVHLFRLLPGVTLEASLARQRAHEEGTRRLLEDPQALNRLVAAWRKAAALEPTPRPRVEAVVRSLLPSLPAGEAPRVGIWADGRGRVLAWDAPAARRSVMPVRMTQIAKVESFRGAEAIRVEGRTFEVHWTTMQPGTTEADLYRMSGPGPGREEVERLTGQER